MEEVFEEPGPTHLERGYESLREATYLGRDRASLFLTAKGKKPGTILEIAYPVENTDGLAEDTEDCRGMLENLGVPFQEEEIIDEDDGEYMACHRQLFMVGKDQDSLNELVAARNDNMDDYPNFGRRLGRALGYPATAIEADATRTALHPNDYPPEIFTDPAWPFCIFALSRDHWKQEMDFVRVQAEFIKKEDPALYDQIAGSNALL